LALPSVVAGPLSGPRNPFASAKIRATPSTVPDAAPEKTAMAAARGRMCYLTIVKLSERGLERLPAEFTAVICNL
jgi:hypothetical protein